MILSSVVKAVRAERDRLNSVLEILEGNSLSKKRKKMSAATRAKMADSQRKRWQAKKKVK